MERWDQLERELHRACPELEVRREELMSRHTSFRVGGPAALMALPRSEAEAERAVRTAAGLGIRPFYLGNGSDLLVSDRGYDGFILKIQGGLTELTRIPGTDQLRAGSGVLLSQLANFALSEGLTGFEFAHGIPGTLGGAVTMNAGAYGGEMVQVLKEVTFLSEEGERQTLPAEQCELTYRHSIFSDGRRLILGAVIGLKPGDPEEIRGRMDDLAERRRSKQPLELPSGGSTFKRPAGHFAAALIEECGLKGMRVGGAQVSEKHAGFVVNTGGATCADILTLTDRIRAEVRKKTGVELELEIKTLGV